MKPSKWTHRNETLKLFASKLEYEEKPQFAKQVDAYQLIKLKVKALGTDSITRDTVRSNNAKVWRDWPICVHELRPEGAYRIPIHYRSRKGQGMPISVGSIVRKLCPKREGGEAENRCWTERVEEGGRRSNKPLDHKACGCESSQGMRTQKEIYNVE